MNENPLPITTKYIQITAGPQTAPMGAYVARPATPGEYPGVIVGFELFGLTGHIRAVAERIARLGYIVIAPDFYHRSAPGIELEANDEGRKRGFELLNQLSRDDALGDVRAAMGYLRDVGATKVGMVGFSVGGHIAYLAATQLDLTATAVFYAGWLPTQDIPLSRPVPTLDLTDGIARHNGSLLFLVGEDDKLIPTGQRVQISKKLQSSGIRHEMVIYPDTPHGFFCDQRDSYHKISADDAWQRVCYLLAQEL